MLRPYSILAPIYPLIENISTETLECKLGTLWVTSLTGYDAWGRGVGHMCVKSSQSPSIDLHYRPLHDAVLVERKWRPSPTTPWPKDILLMIGYDAQPKSDMIIILEHCKVRQGLKLVCKWKQFGPNSGYLAIFLSTAPCPPYQTEILIHGCRRWYTLEAAAYCCRFVSRRCLFELPVPARMLRISGYALVLGNA